MGCFDFLFQFLSKWNVEELNGHTEQELQNLATCNMLWDRDCGVSFFLCLSHSFNFMTFINLCFRNKIGTRQADFSVCFNELHVGTRSLCLQSCLNFSLHLSCLLCLSSITTDFPCGLLQRLNCLRKQDEWCHWETNSLNAFMSNKFNILPFQKNN